MSELNKQHVAVPLPRTDELQKHDCNNIDNFKVMDIPLQEGATLGDFTP